jgi:hypothetical protein
MEQKATLKPWEFDFCLLFLDSLLPETYLDSVWTVCLRQKLQNLFKPSFSFTFFLLRLV